MDGFAVKPIGEVKASEEGCSLEIAPEYVPALRGLDGFSHVLVVWWFDGCDNEESRKKLVERKPYVNGPEAVGTFATRSPERPNPLAVSTAYVTYVDEESGVVGLAWIDAEDGSPVLDIKPYTPSADRGEDFSAPAWCAHWPCSIEESGDFDWTAEFNF